MLRDEYLNRLVDGSHIELYLSANDGARVFWPWRMQPPKEACERYRNACDKYIIDSHIADPTVTIEECLDTAHQLNADIVALVDYMPFKFYETKLDPQDDQGKWQAFQDLRREFDTAYDATLYSLKEGLEIVKKHAYDGEILIPLQKPLVECWNELGQPTDHLLGIGGLKGGTPQERLEAVSTLRNAVGPDVWIHGFGWGIKGLVEPIRDNPTLLDSIDYSTPMQNAAVSNCSTGDERMSVSAMASATRLVRDLREVSDHPDELTPKGLRPENQHGMDAFMTD